MVPAPGSPGQVLVFNLDLELASGIHAHLAAVSILALCPFTEVDRILLFPPGTSFEK